MCWRLLLAVLGGPCNARDRIWVYIQNISTSPLGYLPGPWPTLNCSLWAWRSPVNGVLCTCFLVVSVYPTYERSLCPSLSLFHMMCSRSIHVVALGMLSCFLMVSFPQLYMCHSFSIQFLWLVSLSVLECLACFQIFAILNYSCNEHKGANYLFGIELLGIWSRCPEVELLSQMKTQFLVLFFVLICTSLDQWGKAFFIYLLAICMFSLASFCSAHLPNFWWDWVFIFCLLTFTSALCILDNNRLSDEWWQNILSASGVFLFRSLFLLWCGANISFQPMCYSACLALLLC